MTRVGTAVNEIKDAISMVWRFERQLTFRKSKIAPTILYLKMQETIALLFLSGTYHQEKNPPFKELTESVSYATKSPSSAWQAHSNSSLQHCFLGV